MSTPIEMEISRLHTERTNNRVLFLEGNLDEYSYEKKDNSLLNQLENLFMERNLEEILVSVN